MPLSWATPPAWPIPVLLAAAALAAARSPHPWRLGLPAAAIAALLAVAAVPGLSPLAATMLLLVTVIGGVILRFSRRLLAGRGAEARYVGWFLATVAAAATVIIAGDLLVLALAWTATSLSLHQLLSLAPERPGAAVAAHKKFLISRFADACVLGAVALLASAFGTTSIDGILATVGATALPGGAAAGAAQPLPGTAVAATLLLAAGIVLRSAQMPFHGWLLQVMEAPTPVSALLHAGVVNLGAFVAITLGALFVRVPAAQGLLLLFGTATAVLGLLAMRTHGSAKGALAWSTAAQMGFVLVECGLGAYDLALLHLVAHALYKAHAFLAAGGTVARQLVTPRAAVPAGAGRWTLALLGAALLVTGVAALTWGDALSRSAMQVSAAVLALGLTPMLAAARWSGGVRAAGATLGAAATIPLLYAVWHPAFGALVPPVPGTAPSPAIVVALVAAFAAPLLVQWMASAQANGAVVRRAHALAAAGFHADELFTRLTFRLWPPPLAVAHAVPAHAEASTSIERAA